MQFKRTTTIDKPIEEVWEVLGNQFGQAYKWAASLYHSEAHGSPVIEGASCSNRTCETTQGTIKEALRTFDPQKHVLSYEVLEGFPFFVDTGVNTWSLHKLGRQTRVDMACEIKTKGLVGAVMSPMMKLQMNKLFDGVIEEFHYYVQNDGKPHPRKIASMKKRAAKAA